MDRYLAVDRIENGLAVCYDDNKQRYDIPLCDVDLTEAVKEGDVLKILENGTLLPDREEIQRRQRANLELMRQLMEH